MPDNRELASERLQRRILSQFWVTHYVNPAGVGHCALCGNSGIVDTRPTARTPLGLQTPILDVPRETSTDRPLT